MPGAWELLRAHGDVALAVFGDARSAFERAHAEVRRPRVKSERQQMERVKKLARELKQAIRRSALPRDWATLGMLSSAKGEVPVAIGWREVREDGYGLGAALDISDLLDAVVLMVDQHVDRLPPRTVTRTRDRPLVDAFVRTLTGFMLRRFGDEMRSVVALVATAALDLAQPIDRGDVDAILRNGQKSSR